MNFEIHPLFFFCVHLLSRQVEYYKSKFAPEWCEDPEAKRQLVRDYIEGLLWVCRYYYSGVASWKWFFPHHYAPLACDLVDLEQFGAFEFELGQPYTPMEQVRVGGDWAKFANC
jgi:5'-3' exonuclease